MKIDNILVKDVVTFFNDITVHMQLEIHLKGRRKAFTQLCRNEINFHTDYISWLDGNLEIPGICETKDDDMREKLNEIQRQKEHILNDKIEYGNETFKITSSESDIINTERTILTENKDSTLKKICSERTIGQNNCEEEKNFKRKH